MEKKICTVTLDSFNSWACEEELYEWLIKVAEEIRTIDRKKYSKKPKWNYFITLTDNPEK